MLHWLPCPVQILLLALLGAMIGSAINYGIYAWTWLLRRSISPWQPPHPNAPKRAWMDRIPVLGWLALRREQSLHGKWFWIRPMMIELIWLVGLPWFYFWQLGGGLVGGELSPQPMGWAATTEIWFWLHTALLGLMFVATFIDFDERTIPDMITIPGTLFALLIAATFPESRLPETTSNLAGTTFEPVSFANGNPSPLFGIEAVWFARGAQWHHGSIGLWIALAIFWGWILALLPKVCTLRYGLTRGIRIMFLSCLRPARKTECSIRKVQRRPYLETALLSVLAVVGTIAIIVVKQLLPPENWESLFQSLFGLAFGGLMIWSIRIIASHALQKEAMGFGDVTLMAMIGAFLGWQATLLTLPVAAILALFFVLITFIFTRDSQLAFGPYLCIGAAIVLFTWHKIWPAADLYFSLGEWLFVILGVMLALMLAMLAGLQVMKRVLPGDP